MNKEAFINGFVKAAVALGGDPDYARGFVKAATEPYSWTTPPMHYTMKDEMIPIPTGLLAGAGAAIGGGIGGLGNMGLEATKEKEKRNYLTALLKGSLGGALAGGGAGAAIGGLTHPSSMSRTITGYNMPYDPSQYGY